MSNRIAQLAAMSSLSACGGTANLNQQPVNQPAIQEPAPAFTQNLFDARKNATDRLNGATEVAACIVTADRQFGEFGHSGHLYRVCTVPRPEGECNIVAEQTIINNNRVGVALCEGSVSGSTNCADQGQMAKDLGIGLELDPKTAEWVTKVLCSH